MPLRSPLPLLALAVALALAPALPHAEDRVVAFEAARAEFERAQAGNAGANERAADRFRKLSEDEPANTVFLAYYGSSLTMRGRDAWAPWNKWRYTERGLELVDAAVARLAPEHDRATLRGVPLSLETLLVSANTFLSVPNAFNRLEAAKEAVRAAFASPAFARAPPVIRARFFQQAARVARRDGQPGPEAEALRAALAEWGDAPFAAEARRRLEELGR